MNKGCCTKVVKKSGHSLCLYITKEAKVLGLKKGDCVFVSFEVPECGKNKDSDRGDVIHESE